MSNHDQVWQTGEDVQILDNALSDTPMPDHTRKALIKRASAGLLGAGALGSLLAACGGSSSSSSSSSGAAASAAASSSSTATTSSAGASASGAGDIQTIINTAATAEALAVTYLTAVIQQAPGTPVAKFTARYAAEIGGVEAQHLALVRFAQHKLPDDRAFQSYAIKDMRGIVKALEKAGVGFGKPGAKPGKFYTFKTPPASALTPITHNTPM